MPCSTKRHEIIESITVYNAPDVKPSCISNGTAHHTCLSEKLLPLRHAVDSLVVGCC